MRTVKKGFVRRLEAQSNEAKIQGMEKISSNLNAVIGESETRENDEFYVYSTDSFGKDVEKLFWKIAIRAADFYDCHIDAVTVQNLVEHASDNFIKEIMVHGGIEHGVGAHEPSVPGEDSYKVAIEVEDE